MKHVIWLFIFATYCLPSYLLGEAPIDEIPPRPDQGLYPTFVMAAFALLFFYFVLWRPEQKRRKAIEEQKAALKQGDRVSAMGLIGTIVRIKENTVIIKMYDGSKLEFYKGAVSEILPPNHEESTKED